MSARVTPAFPGQPTPCTSPFRSNGVALGAVLLSESKDEEMKGRQASLGGGTVKLSSILIPPPSVFNTLSVCQENAPVSPAVPRRSFPQGSEGLTDSGRP